MRLTEEQIQAIIDDIVSKMEDVIEDPCNGDFSDFECYEDEYGHCYDFGSHTFDSELEEICLDGLPGISPDDADIYITAKYSADVSFHDDYDPGDYWTPPSGGIEIDEVEASVYDIKIEIDVYNQESDEYEAIEIPQEVINRIENSVNEKICATNKSKVA
jgi:hypothetical protein